MSSPEEKWSKKTGGLPRISFASTILFCCLEISDSSPEMSPFLSYDISNLLVLRGLKKKSSIKEESLTERFSVFQPILFVDRRLRMSS